MLLATLTVNDGMTRMSDGDLDNPSCDIARREEPPTGICTLSAAIAQANHDGGGTINFTSGLTVTESGSGLVNVPITIEGDATLVSTTLILRGAGSTLRGLTFVDGGFVDLTGGASLIEKNTFLNYGAVTIHSNGNVVQDNEIRNSVQGVDIECSGENLVTNNLIIDGDFNAITIDAVQCEAPGNMIIDNRVEGYGGTGIFSEGDNTTIAGNVVVSNGGLAINLTGPDMVVRDNFVGTDADGSQGLGNGRGVQVVGDRARITGNVISGNGGGALNVFGTDALIEDNRLGTDHSGTRALPNQGPGLAATVSDSRILRNVSSANMGAGATLIGDRNRVQGNRFGTDLAAGRHHSDGKRAMGTVGQQWLGKLDRRQVASGCKCDVG